MQFNKELTWSLQVLKLDRQPGHSVAETGLPLDCSKVGCRMQGKEGAVKWFASEINIEPYCSHIGPEADLAPVAVSSNAD